MKCEICGANPATDNICIYRINEFGVKGIWRCKQHLESFKVDPEVQEIVDVIQSDS